MKVKFNTLLKIVLFLLIYKNVLCIFIPVGILQLVPTAIIGFLFILRVGTGEWLKVSYIKFSVLIIFFLFAVLTIKSFLFPNGPVPAKYVILALSQLAVPLMILFVIVMSKRSVWELFTFCLVISLPIVVFGIIEPLISETIVVKLFSIHTLFKYGSAASALSESYRFQDFGIYFRRSGSLFFEPLTLSLYTAIVLIGSANLLKFRRIRLALYLCNFLTIGKVGFLLLLCSHMFKRLKKAGLVVIVLFITLITGVGIKLSSMSQNELVALFSTGGNHVFGMINGFVNATSYPFLGHGLGTSGFIVYRTASADGNVEIFKDPKNKINVPGFEYMSAGGESAFAVLVYQMGYVFFAAFLLFYLLSAYKFYKNRDYWMVGFVLGYLICNVLSESVMAVLIYAMSNILIVAKLNLGTLQKKEMTHTCIAGA